MDRNMCVDAEDTDFMSSLSQERNDNLAMDQFLFSSNCEYTFTRSEPSLVTFYSIKDELIIQNWDIYGTDIWSLYPSESPQTINISDDGCIQWSDADNTILYKICGNDTETVEPIEDMKTMETKMHQLTAFNDDIMVGIIAPVILAVLALLLAAICFLSYQFWPSYKTRKQMIRILSTRNAEEQNEVGNNAEKQMSLPSIDMTISRSKSESFTPQLMRGSGRPLQVSNDMFIVGDVVSEHEYSSLNESSSDTDALESPALWTMGSVLPRMKSLKEAEELEIDMQML